VPISKVKDTYKPNGVYPYCITSYHVHLQEPSPDRNWEISWKNLSKFQVTVPRSKVKGTYKP